MRHDMSIYNLTLDAPFDVANLNGNEQVPWNVA